MRRAPALPDRHRRRLRPASCALTGVLSSVLVLAGAGPALAEEGNQTEEREFAGEIRSVAYDLRLEPLGVQSGLPPRWPQAILSLDAEEDTYAWSARTILLNAPGTPFNPVRAPLHEEHDVLAVELRQSLWTPWPWDAELELDAALDRRTATSGGSTVQGATQFAADPSVQLLLPLWQERYAGVLVGGGVSLPSGATEDWLAAHDALGYLASARWSGVVPGVSWLSCSASGLYHWVEHCTQTIYTANPAIDVRCNYQGWRLGASATLRLSRLVAVGAALDYEHHRFFDISVPGVGGGIAETVWATRYGAFLTVMQPERWFWMVTLKRSQGLDGWVGHGLALGAQLALAIW